MTAYSTRERKTKSMQASSHTLWWLCCCLLQVTSFVIVIAAVVVVGSFGDGKEEVAGANHISDFAPILYSANWTIPQELSQCLTREFSSWKRSHFEFFQPFTKCISLKCSEVITWWYSIFDRGKLLFFHKVRVLCKLKLCWSYWLFLFFFNRALFSITIELQMTPLW